MNLPHDPQWLRAGTWLREAVDGPADVTFLGVPAWRTSLSPTGAHATPRAVRDALDRYSTFSIEHDIDLADLVIRDAGDVVDPDGEDGEARTFDAIVALGGHPGLVIAVGGDNSITYAVMVAVMTDALASAGLVTVDAHFDLRDGVSNGSPVRRLLEAGVSGERVVQIGITDFANSSTYARRARDAGITVITRNEVRERGMDAVMREALDIAGAAGGGIYVDLDVDACDRSVAPGCPASVPGGLTADELRRAAFVAGADSRVMALDLTEVDALADTADERTVRLTALCVLEASLGRASSLFQP